IARHLKLDHPEAQMQFTKYDQKKKVRLLRHRKDTVFESACTMLNQETRRCTVYEARPAICRKFPDSRRCGYYEFLKFEREQQGDPHFIALT
ncbi:MAG TPA: YkgJ family cysteine cluster protein, partial [Usitatibacter sp.]|nr:YkgJ family cysteine cluster protein [Usitatibacter sp.]